MTPTSQTLESPANPPGFSSPLTRSQQGQHSAGDHEHGRYHEQLGPTGLLLALFPVVPSKDQGDEEARADNGQDGPLDGRAQAKWLRQCVQELEYHERPRQIRERPLHELPLFQALEEGG